MALFYILSYYLIIWALVWIGAKLSNYNKKQNPYEGNNTISEDLRNGHIWWLIFPPVNIIAAIVYFLRGLFAAMSNIHLDDVYESIVDFLFGKE